MALNFPNSPTVGQTYTDVTSGFSYEWDGTVWKSYTPASSSNIKILDDISGSFDGVTQTFALTSNSISITPANAQQLRIVLGGVVQSPGVDYTISTSNIVFTTAPDSELDFSGVSLGPAVPVTYANDGNIYIRNTYTGAGTTGPFAFSQGYTIGYLDVYRNGVRLSSGTDFVGTSGTNFFLSEAAEVDDEIEAIGYTVTALVQASSNLDNLNVTGVGTIATLDVNGSADFININSTGIITATSFVGDGSGLSNTGVTLSASSGSQRLVVTSETTGIMTTSATDADLTWNSTTNTLSATNVSIAGTLTYEDVTNVDSIGIITARSGVQVTGGELNVTGNSKTSTLQIGTNPAGVSVGVLGIPNQKRIYGRNAANSADVNIAYIDGSNGMVFGPGDAATITSGGTFQITGQFTSTKANDTATGGGQIYLNGVTGNRIDFNTNGVAAPTFTTRSAGTKIVLFPAISPTEADYAFGIESSTLWSSVPITSNQFKWYGGTTLAATLSGTGNFTAVGNVTGYSDETLKDNIQTIPNALDKVTQLRGVEFDRNDIEGTPHQIGVIAQEVEKIIPEVVTTHEDGIKSVAYGNLVGLLIEAIKDLKEEVNELKARLEEV